MLRCHISAAAPVLISHSEIVHCPWFFVSIFGTKVCHRGYPTKGHVFHPFAHFLNSSTSEIAVDIGLTSNLSAELHEFVGTKAVIFYNTAPMGVNHLFTFFFWTDSIFPVIFICKASARPAQNRNLQFLQSLHDVLTHSVNVGNIAVFSHVNSFINTSSEMFGKMSVYFRCNSA